jgi:tetratricopeptide (TPR) repeat protein
MPQANPVQRRMQKAAELWENLVVADQVRLARLSGREDDRQLFETFLKTEEEETGALPDHFLRFEAAFDRADLYVLNLLALLDAHARELIGAAHENTERADGDKGVPTATAATADEKAAIAAAFPKTWACPKPAPGSDPADIWVQAVASFCQAFGKAFEAFGFYLVPESIASLHEWMRFLYTVAKHPKHPANARHLVWDHAQHPQLKPLADAERVRITTVPVDLDLSGVLNETAAEADDGSPGGTFRRHYIAAATASGKGDMNAATAAADQGAAIASREGWPGLLTALHCVLAAGFMGQKAYPQALSAYDKALAGAGEATAKQDPTGPKLEVQAVAGKASTRIAQGDFAGAAREYEVMAQKAEAAKDERMQLEACRMQAYCHESLKDYETAYRLNGQAVKIAEKMKPEERDASTLPYVGQALTRITQKVHRDQAGAVKAYLDKLMPGWENKVVRRPESA